MGSALGSAKIHPESLAAAIQLCRGSGCLVFQAPDCDLSDRRLGCVILGASKHLDWFEPQVKDRDWQIVQGGAPVDRMVPESDDLVVIHGEDQLFTGGLNGLVKIVDRLLGPGGCPWDQKQTHQTLKKYLLEESYELFEAIDRDDLAQMKEELGDVLLQPLMHAQMRQRDGDWGIHEVANDIAEKLVRRHPHVFGDTAVADADEVLRNWDRIKQSEKQGPVSILGGVPRSLPALLRALQISKRAARVGFEWPDIQSVFHKLDEELTEVHEAIQGENSAAIADELGDLLFTVVNLARWLDVDPEEALANMVDRFTTRFEAMESSAEKPLNELNPDEWDALWESAKSTSTK